MRDQTVSFKRQRQRHQGKSYGMCMVSGWWGDRGWWLLRL